MLKVHTTDGKTVRLDLEDEQQAREWLLQLRDAEYQASITGLTVAYRGVQYSLPRPRGFNTLSYLAEYVAPDSSKKLKGGERVTCFADDVRVGLMVHKEQRAVRITLTKTGRQRFSPLLEG